MPEIPGTNGADTIIGTEDADYIDGLGGNDSIEGGGGNDTLIGGDGWNTVRGGWGDDLVVGGGVDDFLSGSAGDDTIIGLAGNDYGSGRTGDDLLILGDGNDTFSGHEGADTAFGGAGDDWLYMSDYWEAYEAGVNLIGGGQGDDFLWGGAAVDWFYYNANRANEGSDWIDHFNRSNQGENDKIVFNIDDILAASPGIAGLTGNPNELTLSDLDAHADWNIRESTQQVTFTRPSGYVDRSDVGGIIIEFPNGEILIDRIDYNNNTNSFVDLAEYILLVDENLEPDAADYLPNGEPPPDPEPEPEGDPLPDPEPGENVVMGQDWNEWLKGTGNNDFIAALMGDDVVRGYAGDDRMFGGLGDDTMRGEAGNDTMEGGSGTDVFAIRAGKWGEGDDVITDLNVGTETIDFSAADLAKAAWLPALSGDAGVIELHDLDAAANWTVTASADGDVLITHATGSVEVDGLGFGDNRDSFVELADILTIDGQAIPVGEAAPVDPPDDPVDPPDPVDPGTITGNPWNEWLKGTNNAETMDAKAGNDVVRGYAGDDTLIGGTGDDTLRGEADSDVLTGGDGSDVFRFRSGKWGQGDDVVTDFETGLDKLVFVGADMLNQDAGLAGADGVLGLDDLDASGAFSLGASADGDLLIGHQTGSVELDGIAFDNTNDSFVEIANILEIEVG